MSHYYGAMNRCFAHRDFLNERPCCTLFVDVRSSDEEFRDSPNQDRAGQWVACT